MTSPRPKQGCSADLPGHFTLGFRGVSKQYRFVFNPWIWRRKITLPAIVKTSESFWFVGNFIVFGKYEAKENNG